MATEKFVCPHNEEVDCTKAHCERCGWNPTVARKRLRNIKGDRVKMPGDKKYMIPFTGYCEVFASDAEEALNRAEDISQQFFAQYDYGDPVCEEDENELDRQSP